MSLVPSSEQNSESPPKKNRKSHKDERPNEENIVYNQWATFRVKSELYGIDVMKVKEVLRYIEITPVPGADYSVLGIINVRGNVVTVIDTRRMFGISDAPPDDNTRIIVVELNDKEVVGIVVDSVDEVVNLPVNRVERAPSINSDNSDDTPKRFVQGVCYHNNILIILLDLVKMLQGIMPSTPDEVLS